MSRIGKKPIIIPESVNVNINNRNIIIKGPKGELNFKYHPNINVTMDKDIIIVTKKRNDKLSRSLHGLTRRLIFNMIEGVTQGYSKQLELKGIGFRASTDSKILTLNVGFTHPVTINAPENIEFKVDKNTLITISGIDKQQVGQLTADIRSIRPPEPYKGKGIRYIGELVRRKAGKATKTTTQ